MLFEGAVKNGNESDVVLADKVYCAMTKPIILAVLQK